MKSFETVWVAEWTGHWERHFPTETLARTFARKVADKHGLSLRVYMILTTSIKLRRAQ